MTRVPYDQGSFWPGFVLPRVPYGQGSFCPGSVLPGFVLPGFVLPRVRFVCAPAQTPMLSQSEFVLC